MTVIFITMLYSSGMPFLYGVAMISFFFSYLVDKCLFLRFYKKPPQYSKDLSQETASLIKWSLIGHFICGAYMYSNSAILSSSSTAILTSFLEKHTQGWGAFLQTRFSTLHMLIFIFAMLFALFLLIFKLTIFNMC